MSTPDPAHSLVDLRFALEQDFTTETAEDRTQREQRNLCVLGGEIDAPEQLPDAFNRRYWESGFCRHPPACGGGGRRQERQVLH